VKKFFLIASLAASGTSYAQESEDCSQIENARERLACFDRVFPSADRPIVAPTYSVPERRTLPPAKPTVEAPPESAQPAEPPRRRGLFDYPEEINFEAEVAAVRIKDKQRPIYLLANEQVWMQDSPRTAGIRKGDRVTIKNAKLQGYMMVTESGKSIRVRRIK